MKEDYNTRAGYMSGGGKPEWDDDYDFLLMRQDFNGFSQVYFNRGEEREVLEKIPIHMNYSVLYAGTEELRDWADQIIGCYCLVWNRKES